MDGILKVPRFALPRSLRDFRHCEEPRSLSLRGAQQRDAAISPDIRELNSGIAASGSTPPRNDRSRGLPTPRPAEGVQPAYAPEGLRRAKQNDRGNLIRIRKRKSPK